MSIVVRFPGPRDAAGCASPGAEAAPRRRESVGPTAPTQDRPRLTSRTAGTPTPEPLWRHAVGETLREERLDRGWRIADVAERAGVAPQYLSEIERGRKDPSSEILGALAGALGLPVRQVAERAASRLARGPVCLAA